MQPLKNKLYNNREYYFYFLVIAIIVWLWFTQLKFKYEAIYFVALQSSLISFTINKLDKFNKITAVSFAFFYGWFVSFISSIILEAVFSPPLFSIFYKQLNDGVFFDQIINWFIISFIYLGSFQALVLYGIRVKNKKWTTTNKT